MLISTRRKSKRMPKYDDSESGGATVLDYEEMSTTLQPRIR